MWLGVSVVGRACKLRGCPVLCKSVIGYPAGGSRVVGLGASVVGRTCGLRVCLGVFEGVSGYLQVDRTLWVGGSGGWAHLWSLCLSGCV